MSQYKTGTVSVTTGDATVTGTNTLWLSNVTAGDSFTVAGTGVTYEVASVASDTALELTANYAGATASGQSYAITRDFTANYDIPELSQGDIETATVWTRGVRKIDSAIAGVQSGVDQAALKESLLNEATLYADFANGDYRLYEGVGSGLVRNKTFGSVFTHTRGSSATGYGVSDLETVAVDVPRFVYDPQSQQRQGLLIEEARTNLLLWSEAFDNAVWSKTGATITANAETAPDNTQTMDKLVEDTSDGAHRVFQSASASAGTYVLSFFALPAERTKLRLTRLSTNQDSGPDVDLVNLTASGTNSENVTFTELKNGVVLADYVFEVTATDSVGYALDLIAGAGSGSYVGDGTSGLFLWGASIQPGSFPTSYIKTEGAQVTRAEDICSRALGAEFNSAQGTLYVEAEARSGETIITLGSQSIVANSDGLKKYAISYSADPTATTLVFGNATFKKAAYIPDEKSAAELESLTAP